MLKIDIHDADNKQHIQIMGAGSVQNITYELRLVISGLYTQLKRSSPVSAIAFHMAMESIIADKDSPLWEDDPDVVGMTISIPIFKED